MHRPSFMFRRLFLAAIALLLLSSATVSAQNDEPAPPPQRTGIVDINSAPVEQIRGVVLDDLLARRIIENRPYANKRQLVSRKVVTDEQYEQIKDRIIARRGIPEPEPER